MSFITYNKKYILKTFFLQYLPVDTACPQKAERRIFSILPAKNFIFVLHHYIKHLLQKRLIPRSFGWVILNLMYVHFLKCSHFQISLDVLGPMSEEFCRDKQSIRCPVEAHCSVFLLLPRINGLPQNTV